MVVASIIADGLVSDGLVNRRLRLSCRNAISAKKSVLFMASNSTRILVTGGNGMLATALRAYFPMADYASHKSLDVSQWQSCRAWMNRNSYDLVIHAGAATAHDASGQVLLNTNVVGTANMVQLSARQGARFVYLSTDYVYPGTGQKTGYRESDGVWPNGVYAWSKLAGEAATQTYHKSLIVRGSWYDQLSFSRAATDAYTSKIPVTKAAGLVATLSVSTHTGVVNIGGARRSLYEIMATEFDPKVRPCLRADITVGYPIPADVSLDLTRLKALLS